MTRWVLIGTLSILACESKQPEADPVLPDPPCGVRDGMVGLKRLDTGACFWMDARPVSKKEFFDAVEAGMPFADDAACAAHEAHAPQLHTGRSDYCWGEMNFPSDRLQQGASYLKWPPGGNTRHLPMLCASWCDAKAYCDFVGKRLCQSADVGGFDARAARRDEVHSACAAGVRPSRAYDGKNCWCLSAPPGECDTSSGRWVCDLKQCEGPFSGMHCMVTNHIFVQADRPAMQSMGWVGETLDCTLGSVSVDDARDRDLDFANIVCCAD